MDNKIVTAGSGSGLEEGKGFHHFTNEPFSAAEVQAGKQKPGKKWIALGILFIIIGGGAIYRSLLPARNPLDREPELASVYGELRPLHFHMGIDLRTGGKENLPVRSIKNGYISRIVIEEYNMGRSVYVTHSDGTTTVYGHLNSYFDLLESYVHQKQYKDKSWQQDVVFGPVTFPVKEGAIIAYSGNTGQSEAPHLHFEIRNTITGKTLNPKKNGMPVFVNASFHLDGLYWYNRNSGIYGGQGHLIRIKENSSQPVIVDAGRISFGVNAGDILGGNHRSRGINRAHIFLDGQLVFALALDSVSYDQTRDINACIDYPRWFLTGLLIQHLSCLPGNGLRIFSKGDGIIELTDRKVHRIKIQLWDALENTTETEFSIVNSGKGHTKNQLVRGIKLLPNRQNIVSKKGIILNFPLPSFYDTVVLNISSKKSYGESKPSEDYYVGDGSVPVHGYYLVAIQSMLPLNSKARQKTIMELTNKRNRIVVKGKWNGNFMSGRFNELGKISLVADTIPPEISTFQWSADGIFSSEEKTLVIKCSDDYSLSQVTCELDHHWIVCSKKGDYFTYKFDEYCKPGKHDLLVKASDLAGNITVKRFQFSRY